MSEFIKSSQATLYIAMSLFCLKEKSLIPELLSFLNNEQILLFIKMYGGEKIKIPTNEEFVELLEASQCAYYLIVENKTWDFISKTLDFNKNKLGYLKSKIEEWILECSPDELFFIKSLKRADLSI